MAEKTSGNKKQFYEVTTPITSTPIFLYGNSAESLSGKVVKLDLTRILRGRSFELRLKVKSDNGALIAEPIYLGLVSSFAKRTTRKGSDYVEDSIKSECKDGSLLIKPLFVTRNKVSRAVRRKIREIAKESIIAHCTMRTGKELFVELMAGKLQKDLSHKLRKIYPLAACEIRVVEFKEKK